MEQLSELVLESAGAVARIGSIAGLSDVSLLEAQASVALLRRHADAAAASIAGEIARRSRHELGYAGLAQRAGFSDTAALIQSVSKTTRAEATKLVEVGSLGSSASASSPELPTWRTQVASSVSSGELSVDAAEAIRRGLAGIDDRVASSDLIAATERLISLAGSVAPDPLFRRARQARDELDAAGVAAREDSRREQRSFSIWQQADGMYRGRFVLDPESGTLVESAIQSIMSPRRGGPRFVDPTAKAEAEEILADPRSNEQIAADAFVDIVRLAVDADPGTLFGSRRPAVRVIVTERALRERGGHGYLEGNADPVSFETVERHLCDTGAIALKFDDDGQCVNVGRDQRLFTERQRIGMAVRDGGCRFRGCERPPAQCEAHHIDQWQRDGGRTDLADGVLLCRRHHMLLHNNHWRIQRDGGEYWLQPPASVDPLRELIPLPGQAPPNVPRARATASAR